MKNTHMAVLSLEKGAVLHHNDRDYVIVAPADDSRLLVREVSSGEKLLISVADLARGADLRHPPRSTKPSPAHDLQEVSAADWEEAQRRRDILTALLDPGLPTHAAVSGITQSTGISRPTLYRWLQAYRNSGNLLSSLLPSRRNGGRGKSRLPEEVEAIIRGVIEEQYLSAQQPTVAATAIEVRRLCANAGLPPPHHNTVLKRIEWISERERLSRRRGTRAARQRFDPNMGTIPDADWPLALVQMDHTLLPVMVVDEVHRKVIGRPWITLAIDVYSRMTLGMHLSLDPPSAMSAGMCVSHAILGKEKWLAELGLNVEWPCWGVMGSLHMDNAREFRGDMLKLACGEYDIDLLLRPVKKPNYGGHIERLMGTVSTSLKQLQGTTFSGVKERGDYDSEARATMTMAELEKWLVLTFTRYHADIHAGIGTTPRQKWREGLLGGHGRPPRGLPARRLDEQKIRLDFMPFEERTVQDYGVLIDDVHYFHDVLRPWINARDPAYPKHARTFRFRRDPRDISQVYFFDPESQQYFPIPYRDVGLPAVSIWELREAKKQARTQGRKHVDERELFELINQQRQLEDASSQKTKVARRNQQKRAEHDKARKQRATRLSSAAVASPTALPPRIEGYDPTATLNFDEEE